ncbi:hypothetical protein F4780DRAFT_769120 [Xylariomycetidae sp. FL0641]|nr:hypothetical protein F4780DRAFT_769120 [Xylariomycetidae sp. FL0641]
MRFLPPNVVNDANNNNTRDRIPVYLIPWDPDSEEHVERMRMQRVACGWKIECVEDWRDSQRNGDIGLHWVVMAPSHPLTDARIRDHVSAFPDQAEPLKDTSTKIFSRAHIPKPEVTTFHPIGHISLDGVTPDEELMTDPANGVYSLMTFYISRPLQSSGLGAAALDACEEIAKKEFGAKAITLSTIANEDCAVDSPRRIALNRPILKVTNQDWYQRRGYTLYDRKNAAWYDTDSTGKAWPCSGVFMRKNLV